MTMAAEPEYVFYVFSEAEDDDEPDMFAVAEKSFWDEHGHIDDRHLGNDFMPEGFDETMEAVYEYRGGSTNEGREKLINAGFIEVERPTDT